MYATSVKNQKNIIYNQTNVVSSIYSIRYIFILILVTAVSSANTGITTISANIVSSQSGNTTNTIQNVSQQQSNQNVSSATASGKASEKKHLIFACGIDCVLYQFYALQLT